MSDALQRQNDTLLTAPKITSLPPEAIEYLTDPSDPIYGFLADKIRQSEKPDPALVESMKAEGFTSLVQAIQTPDGRIIGVTGRRRNKAAKEAGVNVLVRIVPSTQIPSIETFAQMIRENEIRKEDDIFNRAEKAKAFRLALVEQQRPQIPNPDELGATMPDKNWQPPSRVLADANRTTMLTFGYASREDREAFQKGSGKYSELLSLTNVIESVRKAYRQGKLSISVLHAKKFPQATPARQQRMLEQHLAKLALGENVTAEGARAEAKGNVAGLSKRDQLDLVCAVACPPAVKIWALYSNGELPEEELSNPLLSWLESAQTEKRLREETAERAKIELKAQKVRERESAKALAETERARVKAEKAEAAKAVVEVKKAEAEAAKVARAQEKALLKQAKADAKAAAKLARGNGNGNGHKTLNNPTPPKSKSSPSPSTVAMVEI